MRHISAPYSYGNGAVDPRVATGKPVRWGVVSTGGIATTVTRQLALLEDAELGAVSSRDAARAAEFARAHGFSRSYGDSDGIPGYRLLAEDPSIDVVYVATPHAQHHQVAKALLAAGKHVLVEKAFTINAAEARELVDMARESGSFLMEAMWTRFLPAFQKALDVIASGEIGTVSYVQAALSFQAPDDSRSRLWERSAGGGALLDLAVYPLTWIVGAAGHPSSVHAVGVLADDGVDMQEALTFGYDSGVQAQSLTSFIAAGNSRVRIVGTAGSIENVGGLPGPHGLVVTTDEVREHGFDTKVPQYAYQLREVTRCVQDGLSESPTMPLEDTVKVMAVLDEARRQLGVRYPNDEHVD